MKGKLNASPQICRNLTTARLTTIIHHGNESISILLPSSFMSSLPHHSSIAMVTTSLPLKVQSGDPMLMLCKGWLVAPQIKVNPFETASFSLTCTGRYPVCFFAFSLQWVKETIIFWKTWMYYPYQLFFYSWVFCSSIKIVVLLYLC